MGQNTSDLRSLGAESILKTELEDAVQAHDRARVEFWRVCSAPNGGEPQDVSEAATRQTLAREALVLAIKKLNDFLDKQTVPASLKKLNDFFG